MVLVISDSNKEDFALVWNGSGWVNQVALITTASQDVTDVSVTYEQQSGHAMVVYAKGQTDVHYRTWNGSTWNAEGTISGPSGPSGISDKARWTTLAADPGSDRIALGVLTVSQNVYFAVWDGGTWYSGDMLSAFTDTNDRTYRNIAMAIESDSGHVLATYGEEHNSARYRTWSVSTGWSAELVGPNVGDKPTAMTLDADPASDRIMLSVLDEGKDVNYVLWEGTSVGDG